MSSETFAEEYKAVESGEIKTSDLMKKLDLRSNTYFRYIREYRAKATKTEGD